MRQLFYYLSILAFLMVGCDGDDGGAGTSSFTSNYRLVIENQTELGEYFLSGDFDAIIPGTSTEITFYAGKGSYLSFATKFVKSNDGFYAFEAGGISLYDENDKPIFGNITDKITLWDAGTEINEAPGEGEGQPGGSEEGETEENNVTKLNDGFSYPEVEEVIKFEVLSDSIKNRFVLRITNQSQFSNLSTGLGQGVWVVHKEGQEPIFSAEGQAENGLELLAESGSSDSLATYLEENSPFYSPFSPGIWVLHTGEIEPIFTENAIDRGEGLVLLAEEGDPTALAASLEGKDGVVAYGIFNTPEDTNTAGVLSEGQRYVIPITPEKDLFLSFATMLVRSNDSFISFGEGGYPIYTGDLPFVGDLTDRVRLWDAGSERNEAPGAGNYQPPNVGGDDQNNPVNQTSDDFDYPAIEELIRISLENN
ncbi:spondin domain-containing protein [Sediminitomix flava]|uniref:Spondin N n=1 Tax=Sediminitomix flava TaxID=379075 RepID=A0A315ZDQ4_SEDFL|nr:spondin domain-containing protein [Sediminitomix flava]PWJ43249.1 hypothetical protein BC781_102798 [Sediminitomix flava]